MLIYLEDSSYLKLTDLYTIILSNDKHNIRLSSKSLLLLLFEVRRKRDLFVLEVDQELCYSK